MRKALGWVLLSLPFVALFVGLPVGLFLAGDAEAALSYAVGIGIGVVIIALVIGGFSLIDN